MTTGLLLVMLALNGAPVECETNQPVIFTEAISRVWLFDCGEYEILTCKPQQTVTYWPGMRALDLGRCVDLVFMDGFETEAI